MGWSGPRTRLAAVGALVLAALVASATSRADDPATLRGEAAQLRVERSELQAQAQEALLDLYALESSLARAERRLAVLAERRDAAEREEAAARAQLRVARSDLSEAERRLGIRLQALYVEGEVDPLAIILGAESLDEALSALDDLGRVASLDGSILDQVRVTRRNVDRAVHRLAERRAALDGLLAEAAGERDRLASARAEREAYLADLADRQALTGRAIEQLSARAAAAEAAAATLPASGDASSAPAPAPVPVPTSGSGNQLTVSATGYCLTGTTATGIPTSWGVVAVDPAVIPLGTRMSIPGYGEGVAADTGPAVRGATIDLWFPSCSQALAWGRKTVTITLL
jgi:3D (Asp-Asp-Asp) domain-containing protein/septal ring factor EnvC (AmiA/AmiB activator)